MSTVANESIKRPGDIAARYGGDELVVLLPNNDSVSAAVVAEALRGKIESMSIPHTASQISGRESVTVSVGVASLTPHASISPERLIQVADEVLYQAKSAGRNGVVVHGLYAGESVGDNVK